jgi:hypothetical protein
MTPKSIFGVLRARLRRATGLNSRLIVAAELALVGRKRIADHARGFWSEELFGEALKLSALILDIPPGILTP